MLKKNFSLNDFLDRYRLIERGARILNAGSSSVCIGRNCVNIDIQDKPNVDFICDVHNLPSSLGKFDAVICNAVLQYCHNPEVVAEQFYNVLKKGGYLFVDAPWVQPYCIDTADKYRFSMDALKLIFSSFEILEIGPSIRPGSAFFHLGVNIAQTLTPNIYVNVVLSKAASVLLSPFRNIQTSKAHCTAGAFYLIAQKAL